MKKELLVMMLAGGLLTASAATYYVDAAAGRDAADGLSPQSAIQTLERVNALKLAPGDRVLFHRGGLWRGQLRAQSGAAGHPVFYGAYGEGAKPILQGSLDRSRPEDWTPVRDRVWATRDVPLDVGIFICDHGARWGVKKWDNPSWDVPKEEKWLRSVAKDRDLDFWYRPDEQRVYVRYPSNPGRAFQSIELALTRHIVDENACHDVTYDGLHLRYGAAHGIGGGSTADITIRNCDICWIGGGLQFWQKDKTTGRPIYPVRYGNGIEFWAGCRHNLVERNRLWQIYDAALTNQTNGSPAPETDIVWRDNVVWQAEYSFEYWNHDPSSRTVNILFERNTCIDAGGCWSHDQRPDPNGAHLMFYDNAAPTTNFVVRNNLFVGTTDRAVRFFNDWRVKHPAAQDGLVMTNNLYWIPANKIAEYHVNARERREGRAGAAVRLEPGSWGAGSEEFKRYQQEFGLDAGSVYAEPKFRDAKNHDYRLTPESPGRERGAASSAYPRL